VVHARNGTTSADPMKQVTAQFERTRKCEPECHSKVTAGGQFPIVVEPAAVRIGPPPPRIISANRMSEGPAEILAGTNLADVAVVGRCDASFVVDVGRLARRRRRPRSDLRHGARSGTYSRRS